MFVPILHRLRGLFDVSRGSASAPTHVRRLERADDRLSGEVTLVERLADGDCILCVAGEIIPCRGIVVDGCAAVRHHPPDGLPNDNGHSVLCVGSCVLPGMGVLSNFLVVRVGEESTAECPSWSTSRAMRRRWRRRAEQSESA